MTEVKFDTARVVGIVLSASVVSSLVTLYFTRQTKQVNQPGNQRVNQPTNQPHHQPLLNQIQPNEASIEQADCVTTLLATCFSKGKKQTKTNLRRAIHFRLKDMINHEDTPIKNAERLLLSLAKRNISLGDIDAASLLYAIHVLEAFSERSGTNYVPSGFMNLDSQTNGMVWLKQTFTPHTTPLPDDTTTELELRPSVLVSSSSQGTYSNQNIFAKTDLIQKILSEAGQWDFDVRVLRVATKEQPLQVMGWHLLSTHYNFIQKFNFDPLTVQRWLAHVEAAYTNTPYHNSTHACDVLQTVHFLLTTGCASTYLTDTQVLALLLSAIVHDLGHDGLNNTYHANTISDRALKHNDQSIQESYHISTTFQETVADANINIFAKLSKEVQKDLRNMMIRLVLMTDMAKHFEAEARFQALVAAKGPDVVAWKEGGVEELMCHLLHAADISNPGKPLPLAAYWAECVMLEFFKQGDMEKQRNLPVSPNCDRDKADLETSQIGFISFVVLPTYTKLAKLLPIVGAVCVANLESNLSHWKEMKDRKRANSHDEG